MPDSEKEAEMLFLLLDAGLNPYLKNVSDQEGSEEIGTDQDPRLGTDQDFR
jgi:hypothetical protein